MTQQELYWYTDHKRLWDNLYVRQPAVFLQIMKWLLVVLE